MRHNHRQTHLQPAPNPVNSLRGKAGPGIFPAGQTRVLWIVGVVLCLLIAGCGQTSEPEPSEKMGESIASAQLNEDAAGIQILFYMDVTEPEKGIGVDFRGTLASGNMDLEIVSEDGEYLTDEHISDPGPFTMNMLVGVDKPGKYILQLAWEVPVKASYSLRWAPGRIEIARVQPVALIAGAGMILAALGFLIYAGRKRLGWKYVLLGAFAWVITVALKFTLAAFANSPVYLFLTSRLTQAAGSVVFGIYVGLLTGVFEVALLWLVLRYTRLGQADWRSALGFGIGFGSVEALLLGINSLVAVITAIATPDSLPLSALEAIARQSSLPWALAPIWERFFTILVHIFSNVLLFYGVRRAQARWFWWAFLYKTLLDSMAGFVQIRGLDSIGLVWTVEAVIGVFGLVGWWGTRYLHASYPEPEASPATQPAQQPDGEA